MSRAACRASSARAVSSEGTFSSSLSYRISKGVFNENAVLKQANLNSTVLVLRPAFFFGFLCGRLFALLRTSLSFLFELLLVYVSFVFFQEDLTQGVTPSHGFIKFSELLVGTAFKPASRTVKS